MANVADNPSSPTRWVQRVLVPVEDSAGRRILVPLGPTTWRRQLVAGVVVMAGALPVYMVANSKYGRPPKLSFLLLSIGIIGIVGWLLDGQRYLGAGSAATAIGGGITISREAFISEYALVFALLAVALLCLVRINPRAINGSAGLLIYIAIFTANLRDPVLPRGVAFAMAMVAWGGVRAWRAFKAKPSG